MHREHGWARIRGRNSNTQLVMGFGDVLIIIQIYRKNVKLKNMTFKLKMIFIKLVCRQGAPVYKSHLNKFN